MIQIHHMTLQTRAGAGPEETPSQMKLEEALKGKNNKTTTKKDNYSKRRKKKIKSNVLFILRIHPLTLGSCLEDQPSLRNPGTSQPCELFSLERCVSANKASD